jgi:hypothetical protein
MQDRTGPFESITTDGDYPSLGGPILDLRIRLGSGPWRMGPAWAVIAGALAGNALGLGSGSLLRLAGAVLLADVAWGSIWPETPRRSRFRGRARGNRLPYAAPRAPLQQALAALFSGGSEGEGGGWEGILPGLVLIAALSLLLGSPAILLSLVALAFAGSARVLMVRNRWPALLMALLGVGLPWALGASLAWSQGSTNARIPFDAGLALGIAFTVLAWATWRFRSPGASLSTRTAWFGQVVVVATLAAAKEPLAVAVVGSLMLVPTLWLIRPAESRTGVLDAIVKGDSWWLAAMLVAAMIVR